ncbi:MAG: hypothetical protein M1818_000030 [Claussenomyces sp. TS43310]|nr:MAG: hypothetical protein M1818_000030 [Claussenomyces sp. TS43310]
MADRRQPATSSTRVPGVRRTLFHHHLSRRPTTSSTSTSAETLRLDNESESTTSDIVIRDKNGNYEVGDPPMPPSDDQDEAAQDDLQEDARERQRLADAVKHHQRDRNRSPSEPAELLEAVRASLRAKTAALADDNWMYEADDDPGNR